MSGQSGTVELTPGLSPSVDETITWDKIERFFNDAILRVLEGAITAREIADGSITADELAAEISAQIGLADGSVTLSKLAAGFLLPLSKGGTGATTAVGAAANIVPPANAVQALLTGTARVYNHSSESVAPVEGVKGDHDAFWLVSDDNGDDAEVTITTRYADSKVKISCAFNVDTNDSFSPTVFKLQRSTDGGTNWTDLGLGDSSSTRIRISFLGSRENPDRSMSNVGYCFLDTPGIAGAVMYRVLYSCLGGSIIVLNRDWDVDPDGDAGGITTAEYRCSSVLVAEELWIP